MYNYSITLLLLYYIIITIVQVLEDRKKTFQKELLDLKNEVRK